MANMTLIPLHDLHFCPMYVTSSQEPHLDSIGLGYTVKQIYDKHKVIWWDRIAM
jgi:hypothetical protein